MLRHLLHEIVLRMVSCSVVQGLSENKSWRIVLRVPTGEAQSDHDKFLWHIVFKVSQTSIRTCHVRDFVFQPVEDGPKELRSVTSKEIGRF